MKCLFYKEYIGLCVCYNEFRTQHFGLGIFETKFDTDLVVHYHSSLCMTLCISLSIESLNVQLSAMHWQLCMHFIRIVIAVRELYSECIVLAIITAFD